MNGSWDYQRGSCQVLDKSLTMIATETAETSKLHRVPMLETAKKIVVEPLGGPGKDFTTILPATSRVLYARIYDQETP